MYEEASNEKEYAHVERVNPFFQGLVPWWSEICAAMADDDK